MSKKVIVLRLAAALCAVALAGCGSSGKQPQPTFPPEREDADIGTGPVPGPVDPVGDYVYHTTLDN